ncbi:MAG: cbb3-type cytochrome c oxidase subunit 3 [Rhodospirillales bacterium]|nr:cbb3-type cytochrome c oxidase subunit 3 [Rhodospirillales bacterium]MDH3790313.1 cbb3-type cytochrome c oxidase subunit 3 [Rhodospirillales bacterium]MDH3910583.1 cbb3-type cytochrome c oxidase subunit 3 [Rhodospirillales bacterium]MDH3919840.1 cbb3-type cytochrome c oxidase subunit 3 [Rhodospirillales bacterium]MDH3967376.1 cbb3-type cytochrome c oxidase subunit 3 [Rhodospirillales bacterium]
METLQAIAEALRPFWGLWLMGLFLAIVAWALWPKRKAEMEQHARIPLRDDDGEM